MKLFPPNLRLRSRCRHTRSKELQADQTTLCTLIHITTFVCLGRSLQCSPIQCSVFLPPQRTCRLTIATARAFPAIQTSGPAHMQPCRHSHLSLRSALARQRTAAAAAFLARGKAGPYGSYALQPEQSIAQQLTSGLGPTYCRLIVSRVMAPVQISTARRAGC